MAATRHNKGAFRADGGFSLLEVLITIIVLGILTSIAVPLYVNATNKAEKTQAKANNRIGETMMTQVWMRILDNHGDSYRDPDPPEPMSAPGNVDAEYMSRLESRTKFWRMRRQGGQFGIAGIYKVGELLPGTGTWDSTLTDWSLVYGMIGISFDTYWDAGDGDYKSNVTGPQGERYHHDMVVVVTPGGEALWTTYHNGAPVGGGKFGDPGWDDGRGTPE